MVKTFTIAYLTLSTLLSSATKISTFTDTNCQHSSQILDGPNGYPDGVCSKLVRNGPFSSFQVIQADDGCSVTIYGADTDEQSCSSDRKEFAKKLKCYGNEWVYYSIDMCFNPDSNSTTSSVSISSKDTSSNTGAIVGGTIGGFFFLCTVLVLGYILWNRHRRLTRPPENRSETQPPELPLGSEIQELDSENRQIESSVAPAELGVSEMEASKRKRSLETEPVELPSGDKGLVSTREASELP
ncbi:uncharacterized protein K452DRAFT_266110 [Aplosporella prunicola CBS 121167]|uniref:Uncharacterized protein n=1 Tax=Aplosporella prunicola CBS 121167 TaxID=1176127 RepID=A0A6A6BJM4_9PEZI|nr:uncharacterized protein K452DRAFT_266110 [Aplosporella prunicola CBS 121167]KAF2144360.1 hypothetical protein K452DRAFT_266110 [Aplosporella prunicola CBS 121167]